MKKNYFIIILCLLMVSSSAQDSETIKNDLSIKVDLNIIYDAPGRGITIFYPISGMEDSLKSKIKFPNLSKASDTSFAQIYFTGKNHSGIENTVLVLMGNHSSGSPLIWVDYDNNLDFSDTKKPLSFSKEFIEVTIADIEKPKLAHSIRFHQPDSLKRVEIKEVIEKYITRGKEYSTFYMDERRNIIVGDFVYKKDSLRIGLIDWDVNGSYNDLGIDRLVFGKYGENINGTEESEGAVILDSITYFQGKTFAFEVLEVSQTGKSIKIKPTGKQNIKGRIANGESIPDYAFKLFSEEETSIKKHLDGKKYLYLNFWANWCVGCHAEMDDLKKIHSEYSEKVTLISLNYNENAEKIKSFLDKYEIKWLNGYSTSKINEELFIHGLPRNILLDPSGKIVEMNIHPSKLLERIDQY